MTSHEVAEFIARVSRNAYDASKLFAARSIRVARAIFAATKCHVPAWMAAVLTVCLFIPGPLDELLVLLVIAGMVAFKPVMRADLASAVQTAWAI